MSIETFYTAQSTSQNGAANGRLQTSASAAGKGAAASGALGNGALGFFDMFLQTAAMALEAQKEKGQGQQKSIMDTPLEDIPADSPLAKLINTLPVSEGVEEELAKLDNPTIGDVIALSQQALEQGIVPETQSDVDVEAGAEIETAVTEDMLATDALDENEQNDAPEILKGAFLIEDEKTRPALNNLARILKSVEKLMEQGDGGLIATDLTPAQITDLQEKVEKLLAGIKSDEQAADATEDNAENYAAVVLGLIRILPPQAKNDFITTGKAILLGDAAQNSAPQTIGTKDLSSQLGNIVTEDDSWDSAKSGVLEDFESFLDSMKSEKGGKGLSFDDMLAGKAGNDNAAKNQAALTSVLQNWPFGNSGSLNAPAEFTQQAMDQMGVATGQTQMNSMAAMTSVVTQSHGASQPHPGTQMVAATLQKGAASGEAKSIRIQLDPPELGRVEVRMEFGKDKTVKAVLTAEKPETFMMLQRDAQLLERALQEAGLEADGNSLSFELAQDNEGFSQDGRHDGSRNKTGRNGNEGEEEIIETTMTWQVDPDSGHMRYNILA